MVDLENGGSGKQTTSNDAQKEASIYGDEINLIDYFLVLWKRKWFIFLASVLPTLVVGLAMFLGPRDYKISYTYNMELNEKDFRILKDEFYSTENSEKLVKELQANDYATKIADSRAVKSFASFEIFPSYNELEKLQQIKGTLLIMHVTSQSKEHIRKIALSSL